MAGLSVRVAEHNGNRSPNSIIIPSSGLREFQKLMAETVAADKEIPFKGNAA